ncbi:MAG: hypothetical protein KTR30_16205 [Saprospiraceae bacterium]|nr:hypothetical protein [Saprospiraceae bacterium]
MGKKISKIIYLLLGVVFPILVGMLHTFTHFQDLTTAAVQLQLDSTIEIMGAEQSLWNSWGLMSFMMGVSFIIIGLLHLIIIRKQRREAYPSIPGLGAIIVYLICVVYAANTFSAAPQYYGGILGLVLALLCLVLSLRGRTPSEAALT